MRKFRFLSLFLLCLMGIAAQVSGQETWDKVTYATSFERGTGTQSNPYIIRTPAQLAYFTRQLSSGVNFNGQYIKMERDVDMAGQAISTSSSFYGDFNGNGCMIYNWNPNGQLIGNLYGTVRNLAFIDSYDKVYNHYGIIQQIWNTGLLFNVSRKVNISSVTEDQWKNMVGSGFTNSLRYGRIVNCRINGTVYLYHCTDDDNYSYDSKFYAYAENIDGTNKIINCSSSIYAYGNNSNGYNNQSSKVVSGSYWTDFCNTYTSYDYSKPEAYEGTVTIEIVDPTGTISNKSITLSQPATYADIELPTSSEMSCIGWKRMGTTYDTNSSTSLDRPYVLLQPVWGKGFKQQPTLLNPTVVVDDAAHARYQWYRAPKGGSYSALAGADYTGPTLGSMQVGYNYYCRVTYSNSNDVLTSNTIVCVPTSITDGAYYSNSSRQYVKQIDYSRSFSNVDMNTLFIPFSSPYSLWKDYVEIYDLYNVHQYDMDKDGVKETATLELVRLQDDATVEANTPYVIKAKNATTMKFSLSNAYIESTTNIEPIWCSSTTDKYTFIGTYSSKSLPLNSTFVLKNGVFDVVTSSQSATPMSWYLTVEGRNGGVANVKAVKFDVLDDDTETDVQSPIKSHVVKEVYSLNGVRMTRTHKGLNIIRMSDGSVRKVLVR